MKKKAKLKVTSKSDLDFLSSLFSSSYFDSSNNTVLSHYLFLSSWFDLIGFDAEKEKERVGKGSW